MVPPIAGALTFICVRHSHRLFVSLSATAFMPDDVAAFPLFTRYNQPSEGHSYARLKPARDCYQRDHAVFD